MEIREPRQREQPENKLKKQVVSHLEKRGWYIIKTHGNMYQSGLPDLYCCHPRYGTRWIELKTEKGVLTDAQKVVFSKMRKHGVMIHVITSVKDLGEPGSNKGIFGSDNWYYYITHSTKYMDNKPLME